MLLFKSALYNAGIRQIIINKEGYTPERAINQKGFRKKNITKIKTLDANFIILNKNVTQEKSMS